MGVTTSLTLDISRYGDGCLIMTWAYKTPVLEIDDSIKYPQDSEFSLLLDVFADWMARVEQGPTTPSELWEALELPFDYGQT